MEKGMEIEYPDWSMDKDGNPNSSEYWLLLVNRIEQLIRSKASNEGELVIIPDKEVHALARIILAQLVRNCGLQPTDLTLIR